MNLSRSPRLDGERNSRHSHRLAKGSISGDRNLEVHLAAVAVALCATGVGIFRICADRLKECDSKCCSFAGDQGSTYLEMSMRPEPVVMSWHARTRRATRMALLAGA